MICYSDEARKSALDGIGQIIVKLVNLKPTDGFTLQDIQSTINYLDILKGSIHSEQFNIDMKKFREGRCGGQS